MVNEESDIHYTRCSFLENRAQDGGVVHVADEDGTEATFEKSQLVGNKVTRRGEVGGGVNVGNIYSKVVFCSTKVHRNTISTGAEHHVVVEILPEDDGSVDFCPSRPTGGITVRPGSESRVRDECASC
ncbi:hypothetical protein CBR_g47991 [Chara braunii]|uniref:Right handed beta helix domain-containing protein n=1 Tax=Chara braunii TaxID=69332 RepID=A0A388M1R5_CHABU|nr:hypothetical protein CBR_g47991 [Chara braunii]|eukprot:GBG88520.1 hypothetical protein CBR_g47991 [Chara braunii]